MIFEEGDTSTPGYQLPKIDPEASWADYEEDLTTDGELDLQKVKEFAAHYEWARRNSILTLARISGFSKPHTHASWVAEDVHQATKEEIACVLEEIRTYLEMGDDPKETIEELLKEYQEEV